MPSALKTDGQSFSWIVTSPWRMASARVSAKPTPNTCPASTFNLGEEEMTIIKSFKSLPSPRRVIPAVVGLGLIATAAWAQAPDIKGKWLAQTSACGDLIMIVTAQAPSGVIEGTINCTKPGIAGPFGEKMIQGKQMSAKFDGKDVNIEASTGGYTRLKLEGGKLVGYTAAGGMPRTPVTYVRQ